MGGGGNSQVMRIREVQQYSSDSNRCSKEQTSLYRSDTEEISDGTRPAGYRQEADGNLKMSLSKVDISGGGGRAQGQDVHCKGDGSPAESFTMGD